MRDVNDLTEMIIRHSPRRSRRSLFSEEEAQQYLLGDGGPLLDQSIGMDDLDPAFPDYNVANLFNAYFRDGDTEDDTLDYWEIENGDTALTVEDCAASPGGICLVYAPTGAVSISTKLISAAVPIGPGRGREVGRHHGRAEEAGDAEGDALAEDPALQGSAVSIILLTGARVLGHGYRRRLDLRGWPLSADALAGHC